MNVLYLAPRIFLRQKDGLTLEDILAHEVAHAVLGHTDWLLAMKSQDEKAPKPSQADVEAAADALTERWGFKGSYSREQIRQMRGCGTSSE